jgi:putative selenium metabolism protein SsnA
MTDKQNVLITNGNIATLGENNNYLKNSAIYAEDGIIKDIGASSQLEKLYPDAPKIDMKGMLVLPGNIIAHTHMYSSFARGMALKGEPASNFVQILEKLWWKLDEALNEEDIYLSAMVYLLQCIKYGTTTIIDHHASPGFIDGSLDVLAKAVLESGIRAALCYEVTDRGGQEKAKAGIRENVRFMEKCRQFPMKYIRGHMGIHASFTVSDDTLAECISEAERFDSVIHLHVEEDLADRQDSFEKYGMPVLERLQKTGAVKQPVLAIHCVHVKEPEFDILRKNNIVVIHNPSSNMNNAVGVAPVLKMLDSDITVGLGTDGMTADFFQEMKIFPLLHKINSGDPRTCTFDQIYKTIFFNNPRASSLFWKDAGTGSIEKGQFCDITGLEYHAPTPVTKDNILGHLLFGINSSMVNTTIVNGQLLMKDRTILHLDEEKLMATAAVKASDMWKKM